MKQLLVLSTIVASAFAQVGYYRRAKSYYANPNNEHCGMERLLNPPESARAYSSVWRYNGPHYRPPLANSMIDGTTAWAAVQRVPGQWMQIRVWLDFTHLQCFHEEIICKISFENQKFIFSRTFPKNLWICHNQTLKTTKHHFLKVTYCPISLTAHRPKRFPHPDADRFGTKLRRQRFNDSRTS